MFSEVGSISSLPMRRNAVCLLVMAALLACGGGDSDVEALQQQVDELQSQLDRVTTTTVAQPTTTTVAQTAPVSLTPAQENYCLDVTTVIAVPTASGGTKTRTETVTFFELAQQMDYLELPYGRPEWGQGVAKTPEEFILIVHVFAGVLSTDVGPALLDEWMLNMDGAGIDSSRAFDDVCLQAWELR